MCRPPLRDPTPLQASLQPITVDFVTCGQICSFRDPNLVIFYLCIYLILNKEGFTFHLKYKHSGTFGNLKSEGLFCLKNQKMCDPILVTLLKMPPHDSESSRENATPSSETSPLTSYKEAPPREFSCVLCVNMPSVSLRLKLFLQSQGDSNTCS